AADGPGGVAPHRRIAAMIRPAIAAGWIGPDPLQRERPAAVIHELRRPIPGKAEAQAPIHSRRVHKLRINARTVSVKANPEEPGRARWICRPAPERDLAGAGGIEIIVVADESYLAGRIDIEVICSLCPEDVVLDGDTRG